MYAQLADGIAKDLAAGRFQTGDFLPSEILLSKELGVSRATVTKAYSVLEERRLVARIQGSGTQVAPPPMEREIIEFTGFTQHVQQQGRRPGSRLVRFFEAEAGSAEVTGDPTTAAYPAGSALTVIERVRLVDEKPQGIQRVAIPTQLAHQAGVTKESLQAPDASLYEALAKAGVVLANAEETLVASVATDEECELLRIPKYTPIIEVFRMSFDHSGRMIEAVRARYLGSAYVYKVRLGPRQGL